MKTNMFFFTYKCGVLGETFKEFSDEYNGNLNIIIKNYCTVNKVDSMSDELPDGMVNARYYTHLMIRKILKDIPIMLHMNQNGKPWE